MEWQQIAPSPEGDWINQRDERFVTFQPLGDKAGKSGFIPLFGTYSAGLQTNRDAWVYNFSATRVRENAEAMSDFYNSQVGEFATYCEDRKVSSPRDHVDDFIDLDPTKISWSRSLKSYLAKKEPVVFDASRVTRSMYRPFMREFVYFDRHLNHERSQLPRLFPTPEHKNLGFYVNGFHATAEFAVLATDLMPCLDVFGKGGFFFARYTYRELSTGDDLFASAEGGGTDGDAYERVDNITDAALSDYRKTYGDNTISKDDVFYYTYGLIHSPSYRTQFASDLKKSLPRIPKVRDFRGFAAVGRALADLHIGYESVEPYNGIVEQISGSADTPPSELFRVTKMKIPKKGGEADRSTIIYNNRVTLSNIPEEAYRYQLGARSAIEWIIDRYQVKVDKASGIVNDPNDWSDDPRYIVELLLRIVTVSLETMKIVDALPRLDIIE
ncbi:type ISP restriction/modification enzyme [Streptomyces sp. M10(2022)]